MVGDARSHRGRNAKRLMHAAEIVEREPEHRRCAVVLKLLAERVR